MSTSSACTRAAAALQPSGCCTLLRKVLQCLGLIPLGPLGYEHDCTYPSHLAQGSVAGVLQQLSEGVSDALLASLHNLFVKSWQRPILIWQVDRLRLRFTLHCNINGGSAACASSISPYSYEMTISLPPCVTTLPIFHRHDLQLHRPMHLLCLYATPVPYCTLIATVICIGASSHYHLSHCQH